MSFYLGNVSDVSNTSCFGQLLSCVCVSPNFPHTGKINRAGVSSEDHDLILSSSSQQPIKAFKGSGQIVMVTKPATASSADSHISLVVRAETLLLFSTLVISEKEVSPANNIYKTFFSLNVSLFEVISVLS